jgi:hypothetical protein
MPTEAKGTLGISGVSWADEVGAMSRKATQARKQFWRNIGVTFSKYRDF